MKLAIVGSSKLTVIQRTHAETLIHWAMLDYQKVVQLVISGGATGVDSLAKDYARLEDLQYWEYLPANARWEPEGYKDRNIRIAQDCDELLCIRAKDSTTYGSGWTADHAEGLGKPVWRFYV